MNTGGLHHRPTSVCGFVVHRHKCGNLRVDGLRVVWCANRLDSIAHAQQYGLLNPFTNPTKEIDVTLHLLVLQIAVKKRLREFI